MTDEEKACKAICDSIPCKTMCTKCKCYIAGLKVGKETKWHNLRENHNDLPEPYTTVLDEDGNKTTYQGEGKVAGYEEGFKDGAEFGYNKANEWHYVKDGIMPAENQWVLVYDGSYTVCNYHTYAPIKWLDNYENEVYEGSIIAWCEIPKYMEE